MRYYHEDRRDSGYLPSEGEHLGPYVARLRSVITETRARYHDVHEKLWSHRGPHPCWVCSFEDISDYLSSILEDIHKIDNTRDWVCVRPPKNKDPLTYYWKPFKRKTPLKGWVYGEDPPDS